MPKAIRHLDKSMSLFSDAAQNFLSSFASGEVRVVPIECVSSVIEVKSFLDSNELKTSLYDEHAGGPASVREESSTLPWTCWITPLLRTVRTWDIWPVNFFLFAFDAIDLFTLGNTLIELHGA